MKRPSVAGGDSHGHPITPNQLARLFGRSGVASGTVRVGGAEKPTAKGYEAGGLSRRWRRYLA